MTSGPRPVGFVEWVTKTARVAGHYKTRLRFTKARPWVHLPPSFGEADAEDARSLASELTLAAKNGHAIEWVPEDAEQRGHWRMLVELADGKVVDVDERIADRDRALARAASLATTARDRKVTSDDAAPSTLAFGKWCEKWTAAKRAKGQRAHAVASHLRTHIIPAFGEHRDPRTITKHDVERLVQSLDALVAAHELKWKSAINIWGTITKLFDDMVRGKVLDLRAREDNPCRDVRGPDRGVDTEKVHLYPSEFLALVSCEAVPLFRRRYYAIAVYNYLRPGELEALRWEDVDLERHTIQIRRSINRTDDTEKAPKAGRARLPFDLEPEIVSLLEAMHDETGGEGRVFGDLGDERVLAALLRADLLEAGVDRGELHVRTEEPPREWMTMHDCRTTGITWMACRGDPPLEIMARAGHASLEQTQDYIDAAALLRRGYGSVFPALPRTVFGPNDPTGSKTPRKTAETHGNRRDARGTERREDTENTVQSEALALREPTGNHALVRGSDQVRSTNRYTIYENAGARIRMIAALAGELAGAVDEGDLEAARVAHAAIGALLASEGTEPAGVVQLATKRGKMRDR